MLGLPFVILTGASGSGKTAVAEAIRRKHLYDVEILHFDSIGVPNATELEATQDIESEPGGAWQRATTLRWMEAIADKIARRRSILFEGQMRPVFIRDALRATGILEATVILADCDDVTRIERLSRMRRRPDLADPSMVNWAAFLRREAETMGYEIFDTSRLSLEACAAHVSTALTSQQ